MPGIVQDVAQGSLPVRNDEQRERSLASLRRKRERDARRASGVQHQRGEGLRGQNHLLVPPESAHGVWLDFVGAR